MAFASCQYTFLLKLNSQNQLNYPSHSTCIFCFSRVSLAQMVELDQLAQLATEVSLATLDSLDQKVPL